MRLGHENLLGLAKMAWGVEPSGGKRPAEASTPGYFSHTQIYYNAEVDALYIEFHPLADGTAEARPLSDELSLTTDQMGNWPAGQSWMPARCWAR